MRFPTAPPQWLEGLSPGSAAVALADPATLDATELLDLLSAAEQARHARYMFERDRQLYRVAHALLRTMLGRHLGRPPGSFAFGEGAHRRPHLEGDLELDFNLSHTRGLVAVVLQPGPAAAVGVDVEHIAPDRVTPELSRAVFAPEELAALADRPRDAHVEGFFTLWTLKEAYLKVRGLGMGVLALDAFAFDVDRTQLLRAPDDTTSWSFYADRPTDEHRLAVATRPDVDVQVHWAQP